MTAKPRWLSGLLAAMPLLALSAFAQADPPVVSPQWTTTFWRDIPAMDPMASSERPTWFRLADGSTTLFTTPGGLWFRRFDADGSVAQLIRLTPGQAGILAENVRSVVVEPDPFGGGYSLLIEATYPSMNCWVVRVDSQFDLQWSIDAPGSSAYKDDCRGMHGLADGSVLVLERSALSRIDRNGQVLWSRGWQEGGPHDARAFAVDAQAVAWVVGGRGNNAQVVRYALDGQQASSDEFLCATCIASTVEAIDVLPSGDVIVGGSSGSAQPGFLARYDASGARRLWVDTGLDVHYTRITHDEGGAVYVGVADPYEPAPWEVRRVDPASGVVQWSIEADEFGARAQGLVTLRREAGGIVANAIDGTGASTWSAQVSSYPDATLSRPFARADDGVEFLVDDPSSAATPTCGTSPRLLTLDASGAAVDALQACTQPASQWIWGIDARTDIGVLANIESELVALDPVGDERWRALACPTCMDSLSNHWVTGALTSDGGAWAVRSEFTPDGIRGIRTTIERIAPDGQIAFAVPSAGGAWGPWSSAAMRLFVEPDRVIALTAGTRRLVWQAVGLDGSLLGTHDIEMPDDYFDIRDARLNADGSLTVVALGEIFCSVGCNPFHLSFRRITADGALAWEHDLYYVDWPAMPMPDGGALMVLPDATGSALLMQRFDPQGAAQAPIPLAGVTPNSSAEGVSGPVDGRWLLHTRTYDNQEYALWSIGEDGQVGASRFAAWDSPHAFGSSGYLLPMTTPAGVRMQLLDAVTLETRATLPFGSSGEEWFDYAPWYWRMLDDGSIYGTWLSPIRRLGLARYALPWSAPQDRLFRNGFD